MSWQHLAMKVNRHRNNSYGEALAKPSIKESARSEVRKGVSSSHITEIIARVLMHHREVIAGSDELHNNRE